MKAKKLMSGILAAALAVSMAVPAFAADTDTDKTLTVAGTTNLPTINMSMPTSPTVILNPYGLSVTLNKTDTTGTDAQITSPTMYVQNLSNVAMRVQMQASLKLASGMYAITGNSSDSGDDAITIGDSGAAAPSLANMLSTGKLYSEKVLAAYVLTNIVDATTATIDATIIDSASDSNAFVNPGATSGATMGAVDITAKYDGTESTAGRSGLLTTTATYVGAYTPADADTADTKTYVNYEDNVLGVNVLAAATGTSSLKASAKGTLAFRIVGKTAEGCTTWTAKDTLSVPMVFKFVPTSTSRIKAQSDWDSTTKTLTAAEATTLLTLNAKSGDTDARPDVTIASVVSVTNSNTAVISEVANEVIQTNVENDTIKLTLTPVTGAETGEKSTISVKVLGTDGAYYTWSKDYTVS